MGQVTAAGSDIRDTLEQSDIGDNSDCKHIKDIRSTWCIVFNNEMFKVIFNLSANCSLSAKTVELAFVYCSVYIIYGIHFVYNPSKLNDLKC